jgi:hypothetical protein
MLNTYYIIPYSLLSCYSLLPLSRYSPTEFVLNTNNEQHNEVATSVYWLSNMLSSKPTEQNLMKFSTGMEQRKKRFIQKYLENFRLTDILFLVKTKSNFITCFIYDLTCQLLFRHIIFLQTLNIK